MSRWRNIAVVALFILLCYIAVLLGALKTQTGAILYTAVVMVVGLGGFVWAVYGIRTSTKGKTDKQIETKT